jgi:hypothetical protein
VDLSKTVALTAILFIVVLILTSGRSLGANRLADPVKKPNEATFERSRTNQAARPAGTEHAPTTKAKARPHIVVRPCQYKSVMTEADVRACRAVRRQ